MLFPGVSKKEMDYEFDQGTYPLTQGSREALIKILNKGENTTEGLEILIESDDGFKGFVTYQVRLTEEDDGVCFVVNSEDVSNLPPPSKYQTAPVSMYPAPPEKNNFKISEKNSHKKSNPELHNIFWRAFIHFRDNDKFSVEPQYKQVWETVYNELRAEDRLRDNKKIPSKRKLDPHDHIEVIDPVNVPDPKLQWIISGSDSRISNQGTYSLSSLPPLLSKLKKNTPKI